MINDKFSMILDRDEDIKWSNGINVSSYIKKTFFKTFLLGLFPPVALLMLGIPYSLVLLILSLIKIIPIYIGIAHFIFSLIACFIFILVLNKNGKNTYCAITNKRIIKRSGPFNNKFIHYSLKNVGTIEVAGGLFDNDMSANLIVSVKDYHLNSDGNTNPKKLEINSLNNAYEAYKLLSSLTEGNNKVIRIKEEK